ncbi:MAG: hypothetical protein NUV81_03355 [bacterium]|nr:hypothetical protein [bacterium]
MSWIFIDTTSPGHFYAGELRRGKTLPIQNGRGSRVLPKLASRSGRERIQKSDGICVVAGPGSFSAVRSGVILANLLARLFGKKLVGVTKDDARDLNLLREGLEQGEWEAVSYVAPVYDAEPNITVASSHRSTT